MSDPETLLNHLQQQLDSAPAHIGVVLALSGGLDSMVLLHLLSRLQKQSPLKVRAVHVDHGLQAVSSQWAVFCEQACANHGVRCEAIRLLTQPAPGQSVEAWARTERYRVLAEQLQPDELLLTAQHRLDQAETFLLALSRASGITGLASMAASQPLGRGQLFRPLLAIEQVSLQHYAEQQALQWVEDPSNADQRFDRNFLRAQVLPTLQQRWPSIDKAIAQSASLCADAEHNLLDLAALDAGGAERLKQAQLPVSALASLSAARARNLLRQWLRCNGQRFVPATVIQRLQTELLQQHSNTGTVDWAEVDRPQRMAVRCWRKQLFVGPMLTPPAASWSARHRMSHANAQTIELPAGWGQLQLRKADHGLALQPGQRLTVRVWRAGGRGHPYGRAHSQTLKKLWQEYAAMPWCRQAIPLLYAGDQLLAAAGFWYEQAAVTDTDGYQLQWQSPVAYCLKQTALHSQRP